MSRTVEFAGAARILVQDVVDILESLFKHARNLLNRDANHPGAGRLQEKVGFPAWLGSVTVKTACQVILASVFGLQPLFRLRKQLSKK